MQIVSREKQVFDGDIPKGIELKNTFQPISTSGYYIIAKGLDYIDEDNLATKLECLITAFATEAAEEKVGSLPFAYAASYCIGTFQKMKQSMDRAGQEMPFKVWLGKSDVGSPTIVILRQEAEPNV